MSEQLNKDMSKHFYRASAADFMKIPGSPVAYHIPKTLTDAFSEGTLDEVLRAKSGQNTGDNNRFVKFWSEVSLSKVSFDTSCLNETVNNSKKFYPYNKGGEFRKWYGNFDHVINWENNGAEIKSFAVQRNRGKHWSRYIQNLPYMLKEGITWTFISSSYFGARYTPPGHLFDYAGCSAFPHNSEDIEVYLGYFCSGVAEYILSFLNPTLNLQPGNVVALPIPKISDVDRATVKLQVKELIDIAKSDWDRFERSWDFGGNPLLFADTQSIRASFDYTVKKQSNQLKRAIELESSVKYIFIKAFNLECWLSAEPLASSISLMQNFDYRYSDNNKNDGVNGRYQSEMVEEFISYTIGCMMGRYSLDKQGLILASQGETIQDYLAQFPSPKFMPDDDAILPLTDQEWFTDDVTNRFREFVKVVWGEDTLQENLEFVAESLCLHAIKPKKSETAMDTIRRYLSTQFFADHMKTYKKRPIYWLFSSGKQKAFECLVYLHRYNEGTLSRMRTEYVTPLMGKYESQIRHIEEQQETATTAEKNKLSKALMGYQSKLNELREFDNKLKHYADRRISLDLDDGVKFNYGKFGDLLAKVKEITGNAPVTD